MSLTLRLALALVFVLAGVVLALLSMASGVGSQLDEIYPWLLGTNVALTVVMAILAGLVTLRAWRRYRQRVFGSRLMIRLALAFALMGIVPVLLVSLVSAQFLARTIDSWFSQSVEGALESGAALGRATLDSIQFDALNQARRLALALESVPDERLTEVIESLTEGREGLEVLVLDARGRVIAIRSASLFRLVPDMPSSEAMNRARAARQFVIVEPKPDAKDGLQARALVVSWQPGPGPSQQRLVQWLEPVPDALSRNIEALNTGYSDYRQLALGKQGIRQIYGVTITLSVLLAVFGALSAAVLLSGWLAGPLRSLERATRAVAGGDYPQLREDSVDHELNDLLRSFNEMTRQLAEARQVATESQQRREESAVFLEQVLSHLSAGVMVFDEGWHLRQFNPGAERILALELSLYLDLSLDVLPVLSSVAQDIRSGLADRSEDQGQFEVTSVEGAPISLLMNASRLPSPVAGQPPQFILVFDDISALLSAQRARTWADMARRLAHEIKNPLTPIQLSAERLERKLSGRVGAEEQEWVSKACQTIVSQVSSLKAMVDEFRNYARLPMARPEPLELGLLISEVMPLYAADPRVRPSMWPAACWVMADRGQVIQVIHNLIQNAQDAMESVPGGVIEVGCAIEGGPQTARVVLRVDDEGPGLSAEMAGREFEPYVTSKAKGSGLGLAIVKKIAEENHAEVSIDNRRDSQGHVAGARAELRFAQLILKAENSFHG
ncbi:MAG: HAMP domain-containing protein [Betaproteobacteria bacterium]|nr:HAMP domain-containing protein [Betaproteobacteria bacterium]NBT75021.1 HAMP domain-containing protein [Betaproteobacteria bacterium]NCA16016.1 HAMP domain-containing protein [Betaproteobacteria bacterium]NDF03945.1 HAMP domain-containing protein [Betaproteobacteria bacterium]